ncbi:MAG: serine/threonine-protein kinase, partial [Polyangiaceae bacterium]
MIDETIDGRYEIVRFIGEGGMGAVYEARHVATRRRVAIKLISEEAANDPERLARFRVEAKAAGRIDSDHITQVFDLGHDDERDTPYMAMEYLEGEDLEVLFERRGRLPLHLGLRIVCQALYGLARAHEAGVTHRDIKPANIFLSKRDNGRCVVKLLDFGIAKIRQGDALSASSSGITSAGILIGSPLYMSPEQTKTFKGLDPRTDVWSMGVVLYQALVGVTPFETDAGIGDLILANNTHEVNVRERAPWVPGPVAWVIEKALTVSGKGRYQNATEMAAAVEALLPRGAEIDEVEIDAEPSPEDEELLGNTLAVAAPEPAVGGGAGVAVEVEQGVDEDEAPTRVRHSVPSFEGAPSTMPGDPLGGA